MEGPLLQRDMKNGNGDAVIVHSGVGKCDRALHLAIDELLQVSVLELVIDAHDLATTAFDLADAEENARRVCVGLLTSSEMLFY